MQTRVTPDDPINDFGIVAIDGDTCVVGAPGIYNGIDGVGEAHVFVQSGREWAHQARLTAPDWNYGDDFGLSVAIDGDTVLIGSRSPQQSQGSAYVFVRSAATWTQQAKLLSSHSFSQLVPISVALSGDTAVLGGVADTCCPAPAIADVFVRSGTTWTKQATLLPLQGLLSGVPATPVSIQGDTIIVGALYDSVAGEESGSAYVFTRSGSSWTQQAKIIALDGSANDHFGWSVSVDGDTAVIGTAKYGQGGANSGSIYVFVRSGTVWTQQSKLAPTDGLGNQVYGLASRIKGDMILVGGFTPLAHGGYIFTRSGSAWTQTAVFNPKDGADAASFGRSVDLDLTRAIIGAPGTNPNSGAAYIFGSPPKKLAFLMRFERKWTPALGQLDLRCSKTLGLIGQESDGVRMQYSGVLPVVSNEGGASPRGRGIEAGHGSA